ncbi:MAG: hypothetical protein D6748_04885 [Calditrichaeota bacterium]|nr:MAG: hypothetical protein D6748_04885 [Calditrichota bacterium]
MNVDEAVLRFTNAKPPIFKNKPGYETMMKRIQYISRYFLPFGLTLLVLLSGCEKRFHNLEEFEHYIKSKDSPYVKTIVKNGIRITVRYMPTEAMMIPHYRRYLRKQKNINRNTTLNKKQLAEILQKEKTVLKKQEEKYNQSLYFILNIAYEDPSKDIIYQKMQRGFGEYSRWLQKLLFHLKDYIYLQTPTMEEIPLDTYHLERTYGLRKDRTLLLMFPAEFSNHSLLSPVNRELTMVIKEFGLGVGRLKFEFELPSMVYVL